MQDVNQELEERKGGGESGRKKKKRDKHEHVYIIQEQCTVHVHAVHVHAVH